MIQINLDSQLSLNDDNVNKIITKRKPPNGVIVEKRWPKVITDDNKLHNTNPSHKYY